MHDTVSCLQVKRIKIRLALKQWLNDQVLIHNICYLSRLLFQSE